MIYLTGRKPQAHDAGSRGGEFAVHGLDFDPVAITFVFEMVMLGALLCVLISDGYINRKQRRTLMVLNTLMLITGVAYDLCRSGGAMRIRPERFTCDAYRFYEGDIDAVNTFRGEYMTAYSRASMTEGYLTWKATENHPE